MQYDQEVLGQARKEVQDHPHREVRQLPRRELPRRAPGEVLERAGDQVHLRSRGEMLAGNAPIGFAFATRNLVLVLGS